MRAAAAPSAVAGAAVGSLAAVFAALAKGAITLVRASSPDARVCRCSTGDPATSALASSSDANAASSSCVAARASPVAGGVNGVRKEAAIDKR